MPPIVGSRHDLPVSQNAGKMALSRGSTSETVHPENSQPEPSQLRSVDAGRRLTASATLRLTYEANGEEVRRGTYVVVDGKQVDSVEVNDSIEMVVEPGRHSLQIRDGRKSSSTEAFVAAEGELVAFRCTGKRFLPIFLASFFVPKLALKLARE